MYTFVDREVSVREDTYSGTSVCEVCSPVPFPAAFMLPLLPRGTHLLLALKPQYYLAHDYTGPKTQDLYRTLYRIYDTGLKTAELYCGEGGTTELDNGEGMGVDIIYALSKATIFNASEVLEALSPVSAASMSSHSLQGIVHL